MRHVLALDQGTTSSRAIIFDETGRPVASAQQEFKQHYPQPGWVEHDPDEIWRSQRDVAREALRSSGLKAEQLVACGIANQRETAVVWDRQTGKPIYPAIVWQDRRTAARCAELKEVGAESLVRERTGLVIDPYFSGTKVAWLLDNIPGARAPRRARRARLRHRGHLADLEPVVQQDARHRLHQRLAHHALQHPHGRLGRGAAAAARRAARDAARRLSLVACLRHDRAHGAGRADTDRRHRRRPAGGAVRPGLPQGRHGEEHLRHRLLHAAEHRRPGGEVRQRAAQHGGGAGRPRGRRARRRQGVRARRQRLHRRRGGAVAARRAEVLRILRRRRKAGRRGARLRRRLPRARLHRPGRAALGPARARRDRRPDARLVAARTSRARRSNRSPSRAPTCSKRCRRTRARS